MGNFLKEFRDLYYKDVYNILIDRKIVNEEKAQDISYALIEISEYIEKIYIEIIPKIIESKNSSKEDFEDLFHELKIYFNEIRQFIETAGLTDLKYWDE